MPNLRHALPPLDALVTFEAAARLGGFARAAEELNVTPSAVSQQMRILEDRLGLPLFERGHRSVRLTAAGQQFENSVTVALSHLVAASDHVRASAREDPVMLAVDQSIALLWLPERIAALRRAGTARAIRVVATDDFDTVLNAGHDLAIVHGDGTWDGYDNRLLIPESVVPVCSPAYRQNHPELNASDGLITADLIEFEYQRWTWMNWTIFASEAGLPAPPGRRTLYTNSYPMALDAARRGVGIALGWRGLVDADLRSGALVEASATTATTDRGYHLIWRHNTRLDPGAEALRDAL